MFILAATDDHVKVAAIVAGVQNVYAARAVADGRFTTIPSAIEHLRFKQAANKALVQSWFEGLG